VAYRSLFVFAILASAFMRSSASPQVSEAELSTYECARSLGAMLVADDQTGPVFYRNDIAFTSINASNGSRILIVANAMGLFEFSLPSSGINRLRFELPVNERQTQIYYLGFMPGGGTAQSRIFEFSAGDPPFGKLDEHFKPSHGTRASRLVQHFNFAIFETADTMVNALIDGKLERHSVRRDYIQRCDHLANVLKQVNRIEMLVLGPKIDAPGVKSSPTSSRQPASLNH
jgi:hypothetical protein